MQSFLDRKSLMPPMDPNMPVEENPFYASIMTMFDGFVVAIRSYGGFDIYADKISKWDKMKIMTQYIDVAEPMRNGFLVLNHGDTWINNMMFKSDDDKNPTELCLIDFQMPFWASPAADILYFLTTSVADDIKVDHFDDFIEFYHSELSSALKKLNYDKHIPTLPEFHIDLIDKGFFGESGAFSFSILVFVSNFSILISFKACSCLMIILFVVKYDSPEEISMETLMMEGGSPEMLKRVYQNDCYKKALQLWLPFFNKRGFLDTMIQEEKAELSITDQESLAKA